MEIHVGSHVLLPVLWKRVSDLLRFDLKLIFGRYILNVCVHFEMFLMEQRARQLSAVNQHK